ncbi:hypothetical protein U0070_012047, partial [Myodes glareolus]
YLVGDWAKPDCSCGLGVFGLSLCIQVSKRGNIAQQQEFPWRDPLMIAHAVEIMTEDRIEV